MIIFPAFSLVVLSKMLYDYTSGFRNNLLLTTCCEQVFKSVERELSVLEKGAFISIFRHRKKWISFLSSQTSVRAVDHVDDWDTFKTACPDHAENISETAGGVPDTKKEDLLLGAPDRSGALTLNAFSCTSYDMGRKYSTPYKLWKIFKRQHHNTLLRVC